MCYNHSCKEQTFTKCSIENFSAKKGSLNMFWLETALLTLALALILVGIWHEKKLIAFEDRLWDFISDRIGYIAARVYVAFRKKKVAKLRAERNARADEIAKARRSRLHVVSDNTSSSSRTNSQYIA